MSENKLKKKFNFWGIADIGEGLITSISSTYLSYFLTDVALLPLAVVGSCMTIMSIGDLALVFITGIVLATFPRMKWGRLRSFLLVAPPLAAIAFIFQFTIWKSSVLLSAIIITGSYILGRFFYNLSYSANLSLINVIADNSKDRTRLTSQKMIGANAGKLLGNYLTPVIILTLASTLSESKVYLYIMIGAGVIFVLANLVHFFLSSGTKDDEVKDDEEAHNYSFKEMLAVLATNKQLLYTVFIDLTSNVAALVLPSLAVYYYKYVAEMPELTPTHMLAISLASLAGSLFDRLLGSKINSPRKYLLTIYPIIGIALFSTRFVAYSPYLFLSVNILVHLLTGTTQPFELNLYMNNVNYIKKTTGKDYNSLIMSISSITVKLANILKSVMIPLILAQANYVAGSITPELKQSIINAFSIVPAIIPIVGFLVLKFLYDPEKK